MPSPTHGTLSRPHTQGQPPQSISSLLVNIIFSHCKFSNQPHPSLSQYNYRIMPAESTATNPSTMPVLPYADRPQSNTSLSLFKPCTDSRWGHLAPATLAPTRANVSQFQGTHTSPLVELVKLQCFSQDREN